MEVIDTRDWTVFTLNDPLASMSFKLVGLSVPGHGVYFAGGLDVTNERNDQIHFYTCGNGVPSPPLPSLLPLGTLSSHLHSHSHTSTYIRTLTLPLARTFALHSIPNPNLNL